MPCRKICRTLFALSRFCQSLGLLTSCNSSSNTVALNGAGSTFVYPVMGRWIQDFHQSHSNVQINYQSIGSGGGIQQVKSGTIDFGASDAPLSDQDMAQMTPVIQIPESAGPDMRHLQSGWSAEASAAVFRRACGNFPGQDHELAGSAAQEGQSGREATQPEDHRVHRAESSGTTAAFTTYLAAVSPDWAQQVSKGTR